MALTLHVMIVGAINIVLRETFELGDDSFVMEDVVGIFKCW